MKVRCIKDHADSNNSSVWLVSWVNQTNLEITVGKEYTVLALENNGGKIFVQILCDLNDDYPLPFPIELFQISDNKVSKYWDCNFKVIQDIDELKPSDGKVISFKLWRDMGSSFYEGLLNESKIELTIFEDFKNKMLSE